MNNAKNFRLETERCVFSEYQNDELDLYYSLLGDPVVMQHFPDSSLLDDRDLCRESFDKQLQYYRQKENYGVWKASLKSGQHIGLTVLNQPVLSSTGERGGTIQLGYSLRPEYWHQGYATEFAQAMLQKGFDELDLPEIIALTDQSNHASERVMQKIGMRFEGLSRKYFDHELLLYRIHREEWLNSRL